MGKMKLGSRGTTVLGVIIIIAVAAVIVWRLFFSVGAPSNLIVLSGRIEGDTSDVAPNIGGRVVAVHFRQGDSVRAGDVIAIVSGSQTRAREAQARAAVAAARAKAQSERDQIGVLETQLEATQASLAQSRASYHLAGFTEQSDVALYRTGDVSKQQELTAISTAEQMAAEVAARSAQVASVEQLIAQQLATIASATAQTQQARGVLAEANANGRDLVVRAPFSGTIITRAVEPGEVVAAGTPIVTLLNLKTVYLRAFIPEGAIGNVKLGQPARVYLDSNPNQPIDAYVLRIDPQATFTPENTYFTSDRVLQVFGVNLALRGGFGFAKPGMPADGAILFRGSWPSRPR